jgi:hypothetical protein
MARSSAEDYVRLPLVPRELRSTAFAIWRFRLVAVVLLVLLAASVVWLFLHFTNVAAEDPGLGGALSPARQAALWTPAAH